MATRTQKMPEHQMKPYTCGRLARGRTVEDIEMLSSAILYGDGEGARGIVALTEVDRRWNTVD